MRTALQAISPVSRSLPADGLPFLPFAPPRAERAFCRIELGVVAGALVLLMLVTVPMLAGPKARTERLLCQANLQHIGRAYHLWAADHGDRNPFLVETNEGGIRGVLLANNLWYQYAWISNELATPRVLVCPADTNRVRMAHDFSSSPDGGFLYPTYRNNAVSYFVGLHAFFLAPYSILGGDPNLQVSVPSTSCSYAQLFGGVQGLYLTGSQWTNGVHGVLGNLLFNDGRVEESSVTHLQGVIRFIEADNLSVHILKPL